MKQFFSDVENYKTTFNNALQGSFNDLKNTIANAPNLSLEEMQKAFADYGKAQSSALLSTVNVVLNDPAVSDNKVATRENRNASRINLL